MSRLEILFSHLWVRKLRCRNLSNVESFLKTFEPENWMEDFGSGQVENGVGRVMIDPDFAGTVTANADYHVFLTPRGDSRGLYVANLMVMGFEVHESTSGMSTLGFDYRIVAKRRGYEAKRMVDATEDVKQSRERFLAVKPQPRVLAEK